MLIVGGHRATAAAQYIRRRYLSWLIYRHLVCHPPFGHDCLFFLFLPTKDCTSELVRDRVDPTLQQLKASGGVTAEASMREREKALMTVYQQVGDCYTCSGCV
jgi:hypothetical protein